MSRNTDPATTNSVTSDNPHVTSEIPHVTSPMIPKEHIPVGTRIPIIDIADRVQIVLGGVDKRVQVELREWRLDVADRVHAGFCQHAVWVRVDAGVGVRRRVLLIWDLRRPAC